jgi:hypothetical protein
LKTLSGRDAVVPRTRIHGRQRSSGAARRWQDSKGFVLLAVQHVEQGPRRPPWIAATIALRNTSLNHGNSGQSRDASESPCRPLN